MTSPMRAILGVMVASAFTVPRLAAAGVPVRLQVFDRAVHVFQAFAFSNPDARRAVREVTEFVKSVA